MSPGTSSRAGMTCQLESRRTRALTCKRLPQRLNDAGGAVLLHKAQHGVDNQQRADHGEIGVIPEHGRQHHDQFEHPRRNSPEFSEEFEDRMLLFFGHLVVAVLLAANVHLRAREPGVRVHMERRERVGNRRGGDVRGFGGCRLRGHRLRFGFILGFP